MLPNTHRNDAQLSSNDLRQLENADQLAHFFARLGYNVDGRIPIPDPAALGLGSEDVRHQIHKIELLGEDPVDGDIVIYVFEVRSVTAKLRNEIARRFRDRPENALLVLTTNYDDLEFVMLQKSEERSRSKFQPLKLVIRPVPLAVNRLDPSEVARRVLQRWTFTEEDAAYQWDKLRSAYTLAEWSEEYFNNRALFSDYYLKQRLTDPKLTPEWSADVRPVGRAVAEHILAARKAYTGKPEQHIRTGLYSPVWKLLGFDAVEGKAASADEQEPDCLLYTPGDRAKPLAAVLCYVWNRNLDDVDVQRDPETPDEIPGAAVVSVLQRGVAPWVIVTNGKLWRLYSATASNKATNYYEIDLEEAVASSDQITALKYWWLLFRREAFNGFLDTLLRNSAEYAKELGDRLKDRVFTQIFPQFAKGFIADMRAKGIADLDDDALSGVFSGTMTVLYRLMFVLYAESLDLLPVNEAHGYRELSVRRLKHEIAEVGGTLLDGAPDQINKQYKTDATALYDRLRKLFTVIDRGSADLNMPTYNGGLFSPTSAEGRFLETYAIPDRYLALELDRLARDIDARTQALVMIDFKSLGVRQLGSIYEGLLEFKLRIAAEKLAVTKEKGKEIYQPFANVKKPIATVNTGDVYLENNKRERKATGSYYTPDYIVKYIVQHTVGPVLDRKFDELTPRLRTAQREYRQQAQYAEAKKQSPALFWRSAAMQQLVNDCLNVRVLDPAMGSGHFLVEVVDYVSNRLISFLNGWSENPVWAFLDQTRADILDEMERQHVSIDADRLTRVALLKRAVLKRCVYGVDLNAMAVELAKVSLWLDAFTLGAPLSFLDHHLKWGNSLIGARIKDVQQYLDMRANEQSDLFSGSKFAGVMLATDLMRQVSYLSDNTVEQSRRSAAAYQDASDHLAPYKRVLDVYTSRWFGNQPPKKIKTDYVRLFLRDPQTEAWLRDPAMPLDDRLIPSTQIAATTMRAAADKHFLHWELEFPEVFFAPATPGGQDVQLVEGGGFDAVVGNPPYGVAFQLSDKSYFSSSFQSFQLDFDSYIFFLEHMVSILIHGGLLSFIVPEVWLRLETSENLRKLLLSRLYIKSLSITGRVFDDAVVYTCIPVIVKQAAHPKVETEVVVHNGSVGSVAEVRFTAIQNDWLSNQYARIDYLVSPKYLEMLGKIGRKSELLGSYCDIAQGLTAYDKYRGQDEQVIRTRAYHSYTQKDGTYKVWLEGGDVSRYELDWSGEYISYGPWLAAPRDSKYFRGERLLFREVPGKDKRIQAQLTSSELYYGHSVIPCLSRERSNYDQRYILAVVNSNLVSFYGRYKLPNFSKDTFPKLNPSDVQQLPIAKIAFTTSAAERERLTQQIITRYNAGDNAQVVQLAQAAIKADHTDVVHDLLAHLAQRMIDLNKAKQTETKRFLGWLEGRLKIKGKDGKTTIGSLSGTKNRAFADYLGDYQKAQPHLAFTSDVNEDDFKHFLHKNRNRFGVSLAAAEGEIEQQYEQSLHTLLPIKHDLARTDALIDKIVYRLYGLTDAEIELIERPQYEQALTDAKAQVVADEEIKDDEEKIARIADGILPAAQRFFERVEPTPDEQRLDADLPNWNTLPPAAPTFLLTATYNLRTQPEHMDFSTSVISYAKAIEVVLEQRIFAPFRAAYTAADCHNDFLKKYILHEKHLTLGSFMIILSSTKETALRSFIARQIADAARRVFGDDGLVTILNDDVMRDIRNKAAHNDVSTRTEAQQIRAWALGILGRVL